MRLSRILLYAAAALTGAVAVALLAAPQAPGIGLGTVKPEALAHAALPAPTLPAPAQRATAPRRPETEAMRKRFESAPNYAAFIHDALQRPLEGGRFYAYLAYNRCAELTGIESRHFSQHEQSERRDWAIAVIKDLMRRCEGVRDHFPDFGAIWRRLQIANAKGTPDVLLIERGVLKGTDKKEALNDLARARATRDPYLIAVTLDVNADHYAALSGTGYMPAVHASGLYMAVAAAVCEITDTCVENLQLQMMCAAGGRCEHSDYRDYLRDGLSTEERRQFDIIKLALLKLAKHGR